MKFFVSLLVVQTTVNAFFSVNYAADESHSALMTLPNVFLTVPSAEHVADIYARLSGLPPLLREGSVANRLFSTRYHYQPSNVFHLSHYIERPRKLERESMPALDIFTEQVQQPILLELSGGSK